MRTRSTLLREQRGAILVVAVFMAAFLVGSLWYIIGIGDAIVYRERVQDGADATAYASAVYHARGMNIIVVLNLVMAALLAVLIGLKVLLIVATAALAIVTVICAIPLFGTWACGFIPPLTTAVTTLSARIPGIQARVDKLLMTLSSAQRTVAQVTPWVGSFQSARHARNYSPHVQGGAALSVSMVPNGDRLGLPVQDMPLEDLCVRGAGMVVDIIPFPGGIKRVVGGLFERLVGKFAVFFCGPDTGTQENEPVDPEESCNESKKAADEAMQEWEQQKAAAEANQQPVPPKPAEFDFEKCKQDVENAQQDATEQQTDGKPLGNTRSKTGKEVFADAVNGNDFFSVISLVKGNTALLYRDHEKGVGVAAWQSTPSGSGRVLGAEIAFARADFYYDQTPADGATDWDSYASDAMWHLHWRARLRRFRLPNIDVGGPLVDSIAGGVGEGLEAIQEKYKVEGLTDLAGELSSVIGLDSIAEGAASGINEGVNQPINGLNGEILH